MVAHACSPSYSGGWGRRITWTQEVEAAVSRDAPLHSSLGDWVSLHLEEKKKGNCKPVWVELIRSYTSQEQILPSHLKENFQFLWCWLKAYQKWNAKQLWILNTSYHLATSYPPTVIYYLLVFYSSLWHEYTYDLKLIFILFIFPSWYYCI